MRILLRGSASEGKVTFSYEAPDIVDLMKRKLAPTLTNYAEGQALFRWIPLAMDVGTHRLEFIALAGGIETRMGVMVTVTPGTGAPPTFRVPVGEGTILDLNRDECLEMDLLVEDVDSPEVTLGIEPPAAQNLTLARSRRSPGGCASARRRRRCWRRPSTRWRCRRTTRSIRG
jgi:hypothetical protein